MVVKYKNKVLKTSSTVIYNDNRDNSLVLDIHKDYMQLYNTLNNNSLEVEQDLYINNLNLKEFIILLLSLDYKVNYMSDLQEIEYSNMKVVLKQFIQSDTGEVSYILQFRDN